MDMEDHYFVEAGLDDPRECICGADVADHPEPGDLEFGIDWNEFRTDWKEPSNEFDFDRFELGE